MSKKDYLMLAALLSGTKTYAYHNELNAEAAINFFVETLSDYLETDNERFDREKFIEACK